MMEKCLDGITSNASFQNKDQSPSVIYLVLMKFAMKIKIKFGKNLVGTRLK